MDVETTEQVAWQIIASSYAPTELDLRRMRRESPCRECRGRGVMSGPDWFGNYDACPECDGLGIEGGL